MVIINLISVHQVKLNERDKGCLWQLALFNNTFLF